MKNFENLIRTTQEKLSINKINIPTQQTEFNESKNEEPVQDGQTNSEQVLLGSKQTEQNAQSNLPSNYIQSVQTQELFQQMKESLYIKEKEKQSLLLQLQLQRPLDANDIIIHSSMQKFEGDGSDQLIKILEEKDLKIYELENHLQQTYFELEKTRKILDNERLEYQQTRFEYNQLYISYNQILQKLHSFEAKEIEAQNKLTKEKLELQDQIIKLKDDKSQQQAQIDKLQLALKQLQLNKAEEKKRILVSNGTQTEKISKQFNSSKIQSNEDSNFKILLSDSNNQSLLNTSLLKEQLEDKQKAKNIKQLIKEGIEKQSSNVEKFIFLFIEQKKIKNRSQQEAKFFNDLGKLMGILKEENVNLNEQFLTYTEEQEKKETMIKQAFEETLKEIQILKKNASNEINKLQQDIQKKEEQITLIQLNYENSVQQLNKQMDDLKSELQKLNKIISEQLEQIDQLNQLNLEMTEEEQDLRSQLQQQKSNYLNLDRLIKQMNNQFDITLNEKIETIEQQNYQIEKFDKQLNDQKKLQQERQEEFDNKNEELFNIINQLKNKIKKQEQQIQQQQEDLQDKEMEILNLSRQRDKYMNSLNDSISKIEETETNSDNLNFQLMTLNSELKKAIQDKYYLQTQVEALEKQILNITTKYKQLEIQIKEAISYNQELEQRVQDIRNQKLQIESQLNDHLLSNQGAEQELKLMQDYFDDLSNQNGNLKNQIKQLRDELKRRELEIPDIEGLQNQAQQQFEIEKAGLHTDYKQRIGTYQTKILMQEEEIKQKEKQLEDLQMQLGTIKSISNNGTNWEELLETSYFYNKQGQIKIKVLTREIQRYQSINEQLRDKIKDLETFIQRMLEYSEDNRLLAKQILIQQYEEQQQFKEQDLENSPMEQNFAQDTETNELNENYNSTETFGKVYDEQIF